MEEIKSEIKLTPVLVYGFIDVEEGSDEILDKEQVEKLGLRVYTNGVYEGSKGLIKNWPVYGIIIKPGFKVKKTIETKIEEAIKKLTKRYSIEKQNIKKGLLK